MSKHSSDNESIKTKSTKITEKDSPVEKYQYNEGKNIKYDLSSLKNTVFKSEAKKNVNFQNFDKVSYAEIIYNYLVDDEFSKMKENLSNISEMKSINTNQSDADVLKNMAWVIKKNEYNILSKSYPRDIDIFETITDKLDLMGEDTSDLYDVYE